MTNEEAHYTKMFSGIIGNRVRDAADAGVPPLQVIVVLLSHAAAYYAVAAERMTLPPYDVLTRAAIETARESEQSALFDAAGKQVH